MQGAYIYQPKGSEVEIHGHKFVFYSTHISMLLKLRKFSEEIASGVMSFMTKDPSHYAGKTFKDGATTINDITESKIASFQERKEDGLRKVLDALLNESNMQLMAELICDSLRDEKELSAQLLLDSGDLETFFAMVMGLFEANSSTLDPILGRLAAMNDQAEDPEEPESESQES